MNMKNKIIYFLVLIISLSCLTGCGNNRYNDLKRKFEIKLYRENDKRTVAQIMLYHGMIFMYLRKMQQMSDHNILENYEERELWFKKCFAWYIDENLKDSDTANDLTLNEIRSIINYPWTEITSTDELFSLLADLDSYVDDHKLTDNAIMRYKK